MLRIRKRIPGGDRKKASRSLSETAYCPLEATSRFSSHPDAGAKEIIIEARESAEDVGLFNDAGYFD